MSDIFVTTTGPVRIRRGPRGPIGPAGADGAQGDPGSAGSGTIENTANLIKGDGAGAGLNSTIDPADVITLLANNSGTNTGDQTNVTGNAATVTTIPTLSGDVSNSGNAITLVNVPVTATFASDPTVVRVNDDGWTTYEVTTNDGYTGQTLQDLAELVSGTLSNSSRYELEAKLMFSMSADATGMRIAVHGGGSGSAATALLAVTATSNNQSNANSFIIPSVDNSSSSTVLAATSVLGIIIMRGFVTTRSSGTATISLQHLKVTSGTSTCLPGSKMRLKKCAH